MKKNIITCILLVLTYFTLYSQDTSKFKTKRLPPDVKKYGPYTVTVDNGKTTIVKDPNYHYDTTHMVRRDTSTRTIKFALGAIEIYYPNNNVPVIKKYLIHDINSTVSERLMDTGERIAKYHSRAGVIVVHLKPGVNPINTTELFKLFEVPKAAANLPLYVDYRPITAPNDLLAVPDAIFKISVVKDGDGFTFLNILTKKWEADLKKYEGKIVIWAR